MVKLTQSYAHGVSMTPLIGETIGVHFDQAAERWSDRDALIVRQQNVRWSYGELKRGRRASPPGCWRSGSSPATGSASGRRTTAEWAITQFATRQGRPHPRQHQPRVSPARARIRAQQGRLQGAGHGRRVQVQRLCRHAARARAGARALRARQAAGGAAAGAAPRHPHRRARTPRLLAFRRRARHGRRPPARRACRARRQAAVRRPDQHPVHQRHHRLPKGRDAHPPQHPQQRLLHRRGACGSPTEDRVCIPVPLYHCFGMVLGNLACITHGAAMVYPGGGLRPAGDARSRRGGALHRALRRADHVHRRARPSASSRASTSRRCAPASWPARPARSR